MSMLREKPGADEGKRRDAQSTRHFMETLFLCLVELYDISPEDASATVKRLVDRSAGEAEMLSNGSVAAGWMYHSQPIHVAADVAGVAGPIGEYRWSRYQEIMQRLEKGDADETRHPPASWPEKTGLLHSERS